MKKTITGFILLAAGIAFLLFGKVFAGSSGSGGVDLELALSAVEKLTDDRVGQTVRLKLTEEQQYMDANNYLAFCMNGERTTLLRIRVGDDLAGKYKRLVENGISVIGTVAKGSDDIAQQSFEAAAGYYEMMAEFTGVKLNDEEIRRSISPYYIEVTAADAIMDPGEVFMLRVSAWTGGAVLILLAATVLISRLSDKPVWKIALVFAGVLLIPVVIGTVILFPKLKTASQIRRDGDGIYYLEYTDKLKFDDMLAANITTDEELFGWISKAEFYGLPVNVDINRYGCASFSAKSKEGGVLFGRNFDYGETDTLIVHSKPENGQDGHEFYGMADLYVCGIGKDLGCIDPDFLPGKLLMLASPYIVCDGINDAGLGVSTHELSIEETHQDTGKPDLFVYNAVSLILDRCASVDEALELLGSYDIHSHNSSTQHLFIADKTGRSVVVEWLDNVMQVNELNACTNSVLTPGGYCDLGADWRLPVISAGLEEHKGTLTKEQAKELLDAASQENTEWSCVYDLDNFSVDVYLDEDYERAYHYGNDK